MSNELIKVKVTDHLRGGLSLPGVGGKSLFVASERAPGVWRVCDGVADFTFTQVELDNKEWIEEI